MIAAEHEFYLNLKFKSYSLENHRQYLKRSWRKILDWDITVHVLDFNNHFKHDILFFVVDP